MSNPPRQQVLADAPPGPTLVYKTLRYEGPLRYTALRDECYMADSTAYEAIQHLLEHGLIDRERCDTDLRKSRYFITTDG